MTQMRRSIRSVSVVALAVALLAACSPKDAGVTQAEPGNPHIMLSEGACFGTCPIYDITLRPDGRYALNGERFVKLTGRREGSFGPESWETAVEALEGSGFWTVEAEQTPANLQNCHTDAPTARITWQTEDGKRKVLTYDAGCGVRKTQDLVIALRQALRFDDLVWTDEEFPFDPGPPR